MKSLVRWYYLITKRNQCFRSPLNQRVTKWGNIVEWGDEYLGRNWWYRPNKLNMYDKERIYRKVV